jgi:hypothetical protein
MTPQGMIAGFDSLAWHLVTNKPLPAYTGRKQFTMKIIVLFAVIVAVALPIIDEISTFTNSVVNALPF